MEKEDETNHIRIGERGGPEVSGGRHPLPVPPPPPDGEKKMNKSKLFQRAHALRMEDKRTSGEQTELEFYVGQAIAEQIDDMRNANGEVVLPRATQVRMATMALRRLAPKPIALRKTLLVHLRWPEDLYCIWDSLLKTYGRKPVLLRAIADGMEV